MARINKACIIDDDSIFLFGAKRMIESTSFCDELLVYRNGREALDSLNAMAKEEIELPSVIFLDINMPVLDGWQFLEEFEKIMNEKIINIFILSSSIDPQDLKKAELFESIREFIHKPIRYSDLAKVKEMVD
ncbi:MAG: response regulator [Cryomorphaceae bacterium]|nr:response regulator [Cryomorphaceae bacterium]